MTLYQIKQSTAFLAEGLQKHLLNSGISRFISKLSILLSVNRRLVKKKHVKNWRKNGLETTIVNNFKLIIYEWKDKHIEINRRILDILRIKRVK